MFKFVSRLARLLQQSSPNRHRQGPRFRRLSLEALDPLLMMSVTPLQTVSPVVKADAISYFPTQQQIDQQMGLPMLDSLPGAPATIYLDFDGNFLSSWTTGGTTFKNVSTPVWDMDGNTSNFSAAEQAVIKEVWAAVAEDYAPFNINVSTDYYGSFDNGKALHVAVGGNNSDWLHQDASGISSIGSFHDSQPNIVFAFDMVAWAKAGVTDGEGRPMNGPEALATTISHEAGHSFGLLHHSTYDAHGNLVDEYDPGSSNWTPIMGNNKANDRTTWAFLPTDQGPNIWQDDMAIIAGSNNGFGFRADDHGNTIATADALVRSGNVQTAFSPLTGKGIINQPNDVDAFKFTAPGGLIRIEVDAAKYGPNLLPVLQLDSSNGSLVSNATYASPTRSFIDINLPAGSTYYVMVKSVGEYGDVGQYTVSVGATTISTTSQTNANATALFVSQPTTTTTSTTTNHFANAGNGQGANLTDVTHQNTTSPFISVVTPNVPLTLLKWLNGSARIPTMTQRLGNALHPMLVDAVFGSHF